jgi:tetratricopeptide (TPR) repeat protein
VDPVEARRDALRAQQLGEEIGSERARVRAELPLIIEAIGNGDLARTEELAERAHAAARGNANQQMIYMLRKSSVAHLRGQTPAHETVVLYESLLAANPHAIGTRAVLSSTYATLGKREAALREFDRVVADDFAGLPQDLNTLPTLAMLADTALQLKDAERARLIYERLLPNADEFTMFGVEAGPGGAVALNLANLAAVMQEFEQAEHWFTRAREIHAALGMPLFDRYCELGRVRMLLLRRADGEVKQALKLLQEVARYAEETGIGWLQACVDQLESTVPRLLASRTHAGRA